MQKYILILTKAEYVEAFQQYVTIKMEQEFDIDFILIEDEQFCTFDKFKTFVRSKNPDADQENAFFLLIGGSDFYYGIEQSLGDFQYAQCSKNANDRRMYCTVGRIPGRNIAEIEATCNNVLECGSVQKSQLNLLPITAEQENKDFWTSSFPQYPPLDTTSSASPVVSKAEVISRIERSNFILHMGHGSKSSLALRSKCRLKIDDFHKPQSGYLHIWAWACSTCKDFGSLRENCLLQKKAVSFWGARDTTWIHLNQHSCKFFVQELDKLNGDTSIGEIYFKAVMLIPFNLHYWNILDNAMKYTFLGDPTMLVTV